MVKIDAHQQSTRSELALPSANTMENLAQFQIPEGTQYLSGRVGPNFGYPGGGFQY
ncbi:TNT domain-containing protein [Arthrobacter jiangjiafuii]|uniref:TNT domain-containing protein n=1 Tax=Arthrobacter jiangjiafuii TaxID=2817475 RepID=A0A975R2F1_9MICC|nr:glycohydrolase toxin TNT-related protein [Arthrobacter jiangjiafuii]QWC11464.1 TNT domain-containing protein [Arthrobacter jiangjiafuii]